MHTTSLRDKLRQVFCGGEECDERGRGDIEVVLVRRASAKEPGRYTVEAEVLGTKKFAALI